MIGITVRRLSREGFVNWMAQALAGTPTLPRDEKPQGAKSSDVTLAWPDFQPNARPIVCVAERQLQEFFAFVSTYSTNVRPFTAYFRVMPLELLDNLQHTDHMRSNELQLARMIAGTTIADVWTAAARQAERPSHILPLLQSSLSFVLGQAVLAGYDSNAFDWCLNEWMATRIGRADTLNSRRIGSIGLAWRYILLATRPAPELVSSDNRLIVEFIAAAVQARAVRADMLRTVSEIAGPDLDLVKLLGSSREERISRFNATITQLKSRGEGGLQSEFLAGLLLAIAGNGSFEMMRSAREFEGWLDGAVVWFGICAALFEESNVLVYGNSAGRRIVRDLLRRNDPFDLPSTDISSIELRFARGGKLDIGQIGVHGPRSIEVEILPNVASRVLSGDDPQAGENAEGREALLRTLDEMTYLANRARRILADQGGEERQGDLYKSRRPSRSKS